MLKAWSEKIKEKKPPLVAGRECERVEKGKSGKEEIYESWIKYGKNKK